MIYAKAMHDRVIATRVRCPKSIVWITEGVARTGRPMRKEFGKYIAKDAAWLIACLLAVAVATTLLSPPPRPYPHDGPVAR
jgi:hypothetical protein